MGLFIEMDNKDTVCDGTWTVGSVVRQMDGGDLGRVNR